MVLASHAVVRTISAPQWQRGERESGLLDVICAPLSLLLLLLLLLSGKHFETHARAPGRRDSTRDKHAGLTLSPFFLIPPFLSFPFFLAPSTSTSLVHRTFGGVGLAGWVLLIGFFSAARSTSRLTWTLSKFSALLELSVLPLLIFTAASTALSSWPSTFQAELGCLRVLQGCTRRLRSQVETLMTNCQFERCRTPTSVMSVAPIANSAQ